MADDLATVGFGVDTAELAKGEQALDQLGQAGARLTDRMGAIEAMARRAGVSVEEMRQRVAATTAGQNAFVSGASATKQALEGAGTATSRYKDEVEQLAPAHDRAASSGLGTRTMFRLMAREAALVGGPLSSVIRIMGTMSMVFQRLPIQIAVTVAILAALTAAIYGSLTAFAAFETHQVQIANALVATKNASGQTAVGLDEMAKRLAATGTQSVSDLRAAQDELIKYKSVGGDTFETVLKLAKDVAATGFTDLKNATSAIAKALADPAKANEALASTSLKLSVAQQRLAADLAATGRVAEAQQVILSALSKQVAGADVAASDTLASAWGRLSRAGVGLLAQWGEQITEAFHLKGALDLLAVAADNVAKSGSNPLNPVMKAASGIAAYMSAASTFGRNVVGAAPTTNWASPVSVAGTLMRAGSNTAGAMGTRIGVNFAAQDTDGLKQAEEAWKRYNAAQAVSVAQSRSAQSKIDEVTNALDVQARSAGLNATDQHILADQIKAGVAAFDEFGRVIISTTEKARAVTDAVQGLANIKLGATLTAQSIQQTSALEAQARTQGMAAGAAAEYTTRQNEMAKAQAQGIEVDADRTKQINDLARSVGGLTTSLEAAKIGSQIKFDRLTAGLSQDDVKIAQQLRGLYGDDIPSALRSTQAAALRVNEALKDTRQFVDQMREHTAATQTEGQALGMAAGQAAAYRAAQDFLNRERIRGTQITAEEETRIRAAADAMGEERQRVAELTAQRNADFALTTVGFSELDKQIAQQQRALHGDAWRDYMNDGLAATMRLTASMKELRSVGLQFTQSLVDGLLTNKSLAESLKGAFDGLAKSMANKALESLFSGNFEVAAVQAVIAIGAKLAGNLLDDSQEKELKKAQEAWAGMTKQMRDFVDASHGFDLAPIVSQLHQLQDTAENLWMAATKANDAASAGKIVQAWADSILNAVQKFADPQVGASDAAKQIGDLNQNAAQLTIELLRINPAFASLASEMRNGVAKQIAAIKQQVSAGLDSDINSAVGRGFINDLNALFTRFQQLKTEQTMTGVDSTLIDRWLQLQAQKVVDSAGLVGDSFNDLLNIFPNLTGLVHESTDALQQQADAQKQLKASLNATAGTVVDYLNTLVSGPNAPVSPLVNLASSRQLYDANYGLALGGNLDAQNKFPQLADNLEKAARAVYASAQGYQDIRSLIISQGLALPAVQQTDDPVVIAIRDSITAIHATTAAVDTMRLALKASLDTGNLATVANVLNLYLPKIDTNSDLSISLAEMQTALGGMASNASLRDMFTRLDVDNSGGLTKAELIRAASVDAVTAINANNTKTDGGNQLLSVMQDHLWFVRNLLFPNLQYQTDQSEAHLRAVQDQTYNTAFYTSKVVANTGLTAKGLDLAVTASASGGTFEFVSASLAGYFTTAAAGGWVRGGTPGVDSVRVLAMPDEFIVRESATRSLTSQFGAGVMDMINHGHLPVQTVAVPITPAMPPSDNFDFRALREQMEKLTNLVDLFRRENNSGHGENIRINREGHAGTAGALGRFGDKIATALRFAKRNPRAA